MRVVNFGSLNIDYVYRVDHFVQPGETMSAQSLQIQCGGKGLNQSVALARAGVETWHAGLIGPEGHFLKETLDRAGVHTRFVEESAGSTGHAIIQVDSTGQNSILLHDTGPTASAGWSCRLRPSSRWRNRPGRSSPEWPGSTPAS